MLFNTGLSYSGVNSAKSAVLMYTSFCSSDSVKSDNIVLVKFMKGIFAKRPALPKYSSTWDTSVVLNHLKTLFPLQSISLLQLSRKLAVLLLLLTGQRGQSIHLLDLSIMECNDQSLVIRFGEILKTTKPGSHLHEIVLPAYEACKAICIVHTFKTYVTRTLPIRTSDKRLFISTQKPFGPVSRDTIGRWVKVTLAEAGVNLNVFGSHSTRAAATSKAAGAGVPLQAICRSAGWSNEQTFRLFYDRPITRDEGFGAAILHNV